MRSAPPRVPAAPRSNVSRRPAQPAGDRPRTPVDDVHDDESFSAAVAAVTSAFGDATRRHIYLFTREADGATAGEVARKFALHPNVARHHLDKLAAGGYLDVTLDHAAPGAGRPAKRYRPSSRATTVPLPPRPNELVINLLVRALASLDPAVADHLAEEVGEEYGRVTRRPDGTRRFATLDARRDVRRRRRAHRPRVRRPGRERQHDDVGRARALSVR